MADNIYFENECLCELVNRLSYVFIGLPLLYNQGCAWLYQQRDDCARKFSMPLI